MNWLRWLKSTTNQGVEESRYGLANILDKKLFPAAGSNTSGFTTS